MSDMHSLWGKQDANVWRCTHGAPGVALDLLDGETLIRVSHQDALQQVAAFCRDLGVLGNAVVHPYDAVQHLQSVNHSVTLSLLSFHAICC